MSEILINEPNAFEPWKPNSKAQEKFLALPDEVFECFFGGAKGGGKALDLNTPILTLTGWKPMKDVHPGDYVYSEKGTPTLVVMESEIFTDHRCYELTFDEGSKLVADEDHRWLTLTYDDRQKNFKRTDEYRAKRRASRPSRSTGKRPDLAKANSEATYDYVEQIPQSIKTTREIRDTLMVKNAANHSINVCEPLGCCISVPIDPYTLGAWLGDGASASSLITSHPTDKFILDRIRQAYPVNDHENSPLSHWIVNFNSKLQASNLKNNKHIPEVYYSSDYSVRLALLQGLMDTDGYCAVDGQAEIALSNPKLAEDVFSLICSFGIKAYKTVNAAFLYGERKQDRTRIKFTTHIPVFSLPRKAERQKLSTDIRNSRRFIVDIKEVPTVPMKCIQVVGGTYLAGRSLIVTHNTTLLIRLPLIRQFINHPQFHGVIFRRTYQQLEDEVIPWSRRLYPAWGAKYNETKHVWTFPSGARVRFGYMERDIDATSHDGIEYHYIGWDELTHMTEYQYKRLMSVVRKATSNLPTIFRATGNPGNIGHTWVRERFVEPYCTSGTPIFDSHLLFDEKIKEYRCFIPAKLTDNKHLVEHDPNYINRLRALTLAEQKALIDGDWWAFQGMVFSEFRPSGPNADEIAEYPHANHVIQPFTIPDWWPKLVSIDWGYTNKTAVYWYALSPDQRVFIYREYIAEKTDIMKWGADIRRLSQFDNNIVETVIDPSANQNRGQGQTIKEQVQDATGWALSDADNDRLGGKTLIHEYLRWDPKPKRYVPAEGYDVEKANAILRNHGLDALHDYESLFQEEAPETNLPRLQIFSCCPELIKVIQTCSYAANKNDTKSEDVAEFIGDDPYDSLRYGLKACYRYFYMSQKEFEKQTKIASIQKIAETGDYNALAHAVKRFEKSSRVSPISRRAKTFSHFRPGAKSVYGKYRETLH